jgi:hypothetical protein
MKILDEVRQISSKKIAEKKTASENSYPKLIEKIKIAAGRGETECEFNESDVDQYSQRLLEQDGFTVFATSRQRRINDFKDYLGQQQHNVSVWIVRW